MRPCYVLGKAWAALAFMALTGGLRASMATLESSAAGLGRAGAVAASQDGAQSMGFNPAGLTALRTWQSGLLSASGGLGPETQWEGMVAGPLGQDGVLGLSLQDRRVGQDSTFCQTKASLALAAPLGSWLEAGTRQIFLTSAPGGLVGWSMDAGLQVDVARAWHGRGLRLGLAVQDLASALRWETGAVQRLPMGISSALEWSPSTQTRLSVQTDYLDRGDAGTLSQWLLGAEQRLWKFLALRAGAALKGAGSTLVTVGLGLKIPWSGITWNLDYALASQTGGGVTELLGTRHLAGLSLDFAPKPRGPLRARLQGNTLELAGTAGEDVQSWQLALTDEMGRIMRTFRGRGLVPASLHWDGLDEDGRAVDATNLDYALRTTDSKGVERSRKSVLTGGARARLRGLVKNSGTGIIKSATLQLDAPEGPTLEWEMRLSNDRGKVVKTYRGRGPLPPTLVWDGLDDEGRPVETSSMAYDLRSTDASGVESIRRSILFGRPKSRIRGLKRDLATGRLEPARFPLASPDDDSVGDWELKLTNDRGRVIRTLRGKGRLPQVLAWDGQDDDGRMEETGSLGFELRTTNAKGVQRVRRSLLFTPGFEARQLKALAADAVGPAFYQLRDLDEEPTGSQGGRLKVRPVLKGNSGGDLAGASFDLTHLVAQDVGDWQLKVVDASGRTLRRFSGKGRPPARLSWDGRNDLGELVEDSEGAGFLLRTTDSEGREQAEAGDLVGIVPAAKELKTRRAADPNKIMELARRLTKCQVSTDLDSCTCVFNFEYSSEVIAYDNVFDFWAFAGLAKEAGLNVLSLRGHTDNEGESGYNQELSEKRARLVLEWLQGLGFKSTRVDIEGVGDKEPLVSNDSPEGRRQNRRVEVTASRPYSISADGAR